MKQTANEVYQIYLYLEADTDLFIGKKIFSLPEGHYIYTGKFSGNIIKRVERHMYGTGMKAVYWHIDALSSHSSVTDKDFLLYSVPGTSECDVNQALKGFRNDSDYVHGFGNTDCRKACGGHLIRIPDKRYWKEFYGNYHHS